MAQYSREKIQKVMAQNENLRQEIAFVRRKNEEFNRNLTEMKLKYEQLTKELENAAKNFIDEQQAHQKTQQELYHIQLNEKKDYVVSQESKKPCENGIEKEVPQTKVESSQAQKEQEKEGVKTTSKYWLVEGWW